MLISEQKFNALLIEGACSDHGFDEVLEKSRGTTLFYRKKMRDGEDFRPRLVGDILAALKFVVCRDLRVSDFEHKVSRPSRRKSSRKEVASSAG